MIMYVSPTYGIPTLMQKILTVAYSIMTPLFNPLIYSLRNKDMKLALKNILFRMRISRGAWVVWSVKRPTSAQVMISPPMSSSHTSGPRLTARSLEPASDSTSPSLSAPRLLVLCLSVSFKNGWYWFLFLPPES